MKQTPFVGLCLALIAGIALGNLFVFSISISQLLLVLLLILYFILEKRMKSVLAPSLKSGVLLLAVSTLGCLLISLTKPENNKDSLARNYLPEDRFVAVLESVSSTQGKYKKCEASVLYLIRSGDTIPIRDRVVLFIQAQGNQLKDYDICFFDVALNSIENKNNPGEFDSRFFWNHRGIYYLGFANQASYAPIGEQAKPWTYLFVDIRIFFASLLDKSLSGNELGVGKALILGDRSSLDSEVTGKFGNTGAMHILAVSGLHVGILVQILTLLLGLFSRWISKKQAVLLALLLIWIYSLMTGFSASVARSALMFTLLALSGLYGKNYNNFNVLAFSAFVILIWNPHFLYDIGFQLSYLAMLGIFMFYKPLSGIWFTRYKWIQLAFEGTMVGIAAQIMTVPLTLYYFHQFPNYFILTNLGLMIFSFLILALGLALFAFQFWALAAKFFAALLMFSLFVMLYIIDFIDGLPGAVSSGFVPGMFWVVLLFAVCLLCYYALQYWKFTALKWSLFGASGLLLLLVYQRYEQLACSQICFFNDREISFAVKWKQETHVFYVSRKKETKKIEFLAKSYQKIFPGKLFYYDIGTKKSSHLKTGLHQVDVVHKKGGFSIDIDHQKFFLASSFKNESNGEQIVYASWLRPEDAALRLSNGSIQYSIAGDD